MQLYMHCSQPILFLLKLAICVYFAHFSCEINTKRIEASLFLNKDLPLNYLLSSYIAYSTAACAAATRAIGTLNGEQDT